MRQRESGSLPAAGPGGRGDIYQAGYDVRYNLKKEKGDYSYIYILDVEDPPAKAFTETESWSGTGTLTALDCSSLPSPTEPPW